MNLITRFSDLEGEEKKEKERLMLKVAGRFIGIVNESNLQAKKKRHTQIVKVSGLGHAHSTKLSAAQAGRSVLNSRSPN